MINNFIPIFTGLLFINLILIYTKWPELTKYGVIIISLRFLAVFERVLEEVAVNTLDDTVSQMDFAFDISVFYFLLWANFLNLVFLTRLISNLPWKISVTSTLLAATVVFIVRF